MLLRISAVTCRRQRTSYQGDRDRDRDGDGVPNRADRDRDGHGVRNRDELGLQ